MANLIFKIEIQDIGVDLQTAILAWDEFYPIRQVQDPDDPEKEIPQFSSRKKQIESILADELRKKLNWALTQYSQKGKVVLTKDIFIGE